MKGTCSNITCIWAGICSGGAYIKAASIKTRGAVGASIRSTDVGVTCIENTSIGVIFIVMTCIGSASDKSVYIRSICAESAGAVKHSEIDLQSFWISKVKLFNT